MLSPAISASRFYKVFVWLVFGYLAARLVFFAFTIHPGIPPDEVNHVLTVIHYSKSALLPSDTPESYALGPIAHRPYLYYFLMGKLLRLNVLPIPDLVYLRLLNALLGLALAWVAWGWIRLLSADRLVHVLFLVLLTNTAMLSFLSASVSYDNLTNLLAALSLFLLFDFLRTPSAARLAQLTACLAAGCLTKLTFLPLAAVLAVVLVFHVISHRIPPWKPPSEWLARPSARTGALVLSAAVLGGLALFLYAANVVRFGHVAPRCDQMLPEASCLQNRIWARDAVIMSYARGERTYEEAVRAAADLEYVQDRDGAIGVMTSRKKARESSQPPLDRLHYAVRWSSIMLDGIHGIYGHRVMFKGRRFILLYGLIFSACFLAVVVHAVSPRRGVFWLYAAGIAFSYLLVLMLVVNYRGYLITRYITLAVQGRYAFPVLIPLYGLVVQGLIGHWRSEKVRLAVSVAVSALFVGGDFPYFLANASDAWFR